jgi:hypothetical protein
VIDELPVAAAGSLAREINKIEQSADLGSGYW